MYLLRCGEGGSAFLRLQVSLNVSVLAAPAVVQLKEGGKDTPVVPDASIEVDRYAEADAEDQGTAQVEEEL
jgi:hypothetical protein